MKFSKMEIIKDGRLNINYIKLLVARSLILDSMGSIAEYYPELSKQCQIKAIEIISTITEE